MLGSEMDLEFVGSNRPQFIYISWATSPWLISLHSLPMGLTFQDKQAGLTVATTVMERLIRLLDRGLGIKSKERLKTII
jgi:hypothetical protein